MKNRILIFIIVILLTNFLSAYEITITPETVAPISMFSGETKIINLTLCHDFKQTQKLDLSYNITNNTFNLDGLYISFSKNPVYTDNCKDIQIFITTHSSYKPDSWVLEIYAETLYEGKIYVSRGGGSSYQPKLKEIILDKQGCSISEGFFFCESRHMCVNDIEDCYLLEKETINLAEGTILGETKTTTNFLTGAVIGTLGTGGTVIVAVFTILIVIVTGFIIARNYK